MNHGGSASAAVVPLGVRPLSVSPATHVTVTSGSPGKLPDLSLSPTVDQVGVEERAARFQTRSIKTASKMEALKLTLSMIDLTTLSGMDSPGQSETAV